MINSPIRTFATGTYTVTRRAAQTLNAGVVVPGTSSTFTLVGSAQPVGMGRRLEALPEAFRSSELLTLYTETALRPVDENGLPVDTIVIGTKTYAVVGVEPWKHRGVQHYRCTVAKVSLP